jgi:hypothetical protein
MNYCDTWCSWVCSDARSKVSLMVRESVLVALPGEAFIARSSHSERFRPHDTRMYRGCLRRATFNILCMPTLTPKLHSSPSHPTPQNHSKTLSSRISTHAPRIHRVLGMKPGSTIRTLGNTQDVAGAARSGVDCSTDITVRHAGGLVPWSFGAVPQRRGALRGTRAASTNELARFYGCTRTTQAAS